MAAPLTPANFAAQTGNGQVYLTWSVSVGATSYNIYRSTDNVTFTLLDTSIINNYLDTTAALNTQYFYTVNASDGTNTSYQSNSVAAIATQTGIDCLSQLRLMAQQRADRVNSNFVSTTEWNSYINQSAAELYDLLITTYEDYYLAQPYIFQTDGSTSSYELPNGTLVGTDGVTTKPFYKLMGVDLGITSSNNARVTIHKYNFVDRNRYVYPNVTSTYYGVFNLRYRVMGNNIHFIPQPAGGQYVTVHYIPRLPVMLKDTDYIESISGWSEYVVVDAAIKALQKEESDTSLLMAQKMALKQRIEETAQNRDAGGPATISRTRGSGWAQYNGPGGDGSFGGW